MKIILAFCTLIVLMGCGIKGDPLPPAEQETIQKQEPASSEPAKPALDKKKVKK